jgi:hypothetical protein
MSQTALLSYFVDEKTTWLFVLGPDAAEPLAEDTGVPPDHLRACAERLLIDCHGHPGKLEPERKTQIEQAKKLPPLIGDASRPQGHGPEPRKLLGPKYKLTYLDDLSDKLLPTALRPVLNDCEVLCISAHGPLHSLPLHALRWSDGAYLAERFGVCYVPSVGVLRHCRERNRARRATSLDRPETGLVACVDMFGEQASEFEADRDLLAPLCRRGAGNQACQVPTPFGTGKRCCIVLPHSRNCRAWMVRRCGRRTENTTTGRSATLWPVRRGGTCKSRSPRNQSLCGSTA